MLTTQQVADTLGVSAPTVRAMLGRNELAGERVTVRGRLVWRVNDDSVAERARARVDSARARVTLASIDARLARLEGVALASPPGTGTSPPPSAAPGTLGSGVDALALRAVAAEQAAADQARAGVVEHLLAALRASEDADKHRRSALAAAETALGFKLVPDDVSRVSPSFLPQG